MWRKNTGKCEVVSTTGFWVGAVPSVRRMTQDAEIILELGDTLVLHTDGITEARNARQEQFSEERLVAIIESKGGLASHLIRDAITETVRGWTASVDDDMTLLVVTYVGG